MTIKGPDKVLPVDRREVPLARVVEVDGAEGASRRRGANFRAVAAVRHQHNHPH